MKYFNYNIKKKNFYFSLVLYFYFFTYNLLFFFQIDVLNHQSCNQIFLLLKNSYNIKYLKLNISNILSIFKSYNNSKYIFTIFKRDILFLSAANSFILNFLNNSLLLNNLVMFCIDYYFINVKYLNNLFIIYKFSFNNFNFLKIFSMKLLYITYCYIYNIHSIIKFLN